MNIERSSRAPQVWNAVKIEILDNGLARLDKAWDQAHPRPPFSRIYYILDGEGSASGGGETAALQAGRVYLLPAGLSIRYACPREMTQLYFHVDVRTADGYDLFSRCGRILELPMEIDAAQMAQVYRSSDYLPLALLKHRVQADVCRFISAARLEEHLMAPQSAFLQRVFAAVRKDLRSTLTVGSVAKALAVSESALAKRFHREFGITLGRYIDEMLIHEICRLLASTELSVGEIAERLDFCDQFYLSRFFSARQGMPPREYRVHLRE